MFENDSRLSEGMQSKWTKSMKINLDEVYVSSQNVWELVS